MFASLADQLKSQRDGITRYGLLTAFVLFVAMVGPCSAQGAKVIKIGVRADAPPFSFSTEDGEYDGYTVELCRLIANEAISERMFDRIEMVKVTVSDRFQQLRDGKIDMLCEASTVTLERMRAADFSLLTFLSGASVMYNRKTIEDVSGDGGEGCKLTIGMLKHTTTSDEINKVIGKFSSGSEVAPAGCQIEGPKEFECHTEAVRQLLKGSIHIYLADREILLAFKQKGIGSEAHENASLSDLEVSQHYYTFEPYAIGINTEQRDLRLIANEVLSKLFNWQEGPTGNTIATVLRRYFPNKKFSQDLEYMFRLQRFRRGERVP